MVPIGKPKKVGKGKKRPFINPEEQPIPLEVPEEVPVEQPIPVEFPIPVEIPLQPQER